MKYTPEQLKDLHAAIDAYSQGKPCEWSVNGEWWHPIESDQEWVIGKSLFRPKPEPKTRPWSKPDDVPGPVCWIRDVERETSCALIVSLHNYGFRTVYCDLLWGLLTGYQYSTDRKTWFPCTATEP